MNRGPSESLCDHSLCCVKAPQQKPQQFQAETSSALKNKKTQGEEKKEKENIHVYPYSNIEPSKRREKQNNKKKNKKNNV